jgi:hypothetical protein
MRHQAGRGSLALTNVVTKGGKTKGGAMKASVLLAFLAAVLALAVPAAARADPQCGADECTEVTPVPSIDPEWSANFVPPPLPPVRAATACLPADVVFYAETDWLRLAQKMRANMSLCTSYYVSIPPVVADKTKPRGPLQAGYIRDLGDNFHAMNDINVAAWTSWVAADPGRTWYGAGVEARRRMDDPAVGGFDPAAGDIWALNELSSAVRQGTGLSRQNMREFIRGLYDGDGGPPMRGLVWVAGMSQGTTNFDVYKPNVKNWLRDAAFWSDMSQYVAFFSQEVYGRVDKWAVPGTTPQDRLVPTVDYLEHYATLAGAGAYELGDTAAYLALADAPTGNAAWPRPGYEWPVPPVDYTVAAGYAAGQVFAFRHDQSGREGNQVFGLAWNPTNLAAPNTPIPDFVNKTAFIAERIAAAIHASDAPSAEPGLAACGADLAWCGGDVAGASFNPRWLIFNDWTAPTAEASTEIVQANGFGQLVLSATDPDPGQRLTFSIVTQPVHGAAVNDGSASVTYTPEPGYAGMDSFTFQVFDGWMNSTEATVTIKVNEPPVVDAGPDVTTPWGVPTTLGGTATDPDGDSTAVVASWDFGDGLKGTGLQPSHVYPDPGSYTAELTVVDGDGGTATDTARVTVGPRPSSLTLKATATLDVSNATVAAQLGDAVGSPSRLQGHAVTFTAGGATCTASTNGSGDAACTLPAAALALGPSTVTARFAGDSLYSESTGAGSAILYGRPADGIFVVGDRSATGAVTFWSPSWWLLNSLSGGRAPASFKGFATAGPGGWVAQPGLGHAPASAPAWMAVLVASRIEKEGSSIMLTASPLIVVHVDAYDPHLIGRGTVVAAID